MRWAFKGWHIRTTGALSIARRLAVPASKQRRLSRRLSALIRELRSRFTAFC